MLSNTGSPSSVGDSDVDQRVSKKMKSAEVAVDNGVTTTIPVSGVNQCVEDTLCAHDLSDEMVEADSRNEAPARDEIALKQRQMIVNVLLKMRYNF